MDNEDQNKVNQQGNNDQNKVNQQGNNDQNKVNQQGNNDQNKVNQQGNNDQHKQSQNKATNAKVVGAGNAQNQTVVENKKITITPEDIEKWNLSQEDADFLADSKAAMLAKTTPVSKFLLFFIISFIIIGAVWSSRAKLEEVTRGIGKFIPASKVQIIQNLEGGILETIKVQEGDEIKRGQILAKLDCTKFKADYNEAHSQYLAMLATIDRLKAEYNEQKQIGFSKLVLKDASLVKREKNLFNMRKKYLTNRLSHLKKSYELALNELNIIKPLAEKDIVSDIELIRLQREVNQIQSKIKIVKDSFMQEVVEELAKITANSQSLKERLISLKDRMQRTTINSPIDGVVKQIYINNYGEVIKPGMPIMDIVPLNDELVVEAKINPDKIAFIKTGQKATVKVTAYDYAIYGNMPAVVYNISPDTSVDKKGNTYYEVNLHVDKNYLGDKPDVFPLKPGMVAVVDIITGKKSILTYILKPILRAKEKALRER